MIKLQTNKRTINNGSQGNKIKIGDTTYLQNDVFEDSGHIKEEVWEIILFHLKRISDSNLTRDIQANLNNYRKFKLLYPIFSDWLNESLETRIGKEDGNEAEVINYNARLYILCQAVCGLKLDYFYIFPTLYPSVFRWVCQVFGNDILIEEILKIQAGIRQYKQERDNKYIICRIFYALYLHTHKSYRKITEANLLELYRSIKKHEKLGINRYTNFFKDIYKSIYRAETILITAKIIKGGIINKKTKPSVQDRLERRINSIKHPKIKNVVLQYYADIKNIKEAATLDASIYPVVSFIQWLYEKHKNIDTLMLLTRKIVLNYLDYKKNDQGLLPQSMEHLVSRLNTFFSAIGENNYADIPLEKVISLQDHKKVPRSEPRYIPEDELRQIMDLIYKYADPYFKNMGIILRWTGLRKDELLRLEVDALNYDIEHKPWLRVPPSKTNNERNIPIHKDAEAAFKELLQLRNNGNNTTPLIDRKTKKGTHYLLVRNNSMFRGDYLNEHLRKICKQLGFMNAKGRAKYTSHSFRHTIATEMINSGASIGAIMDFLGHESFQMVLTYARMFKKTVQADYYKTIEAIEKREASFIDKQNTPVLYKIDINTDNLYRTSLGIGNCYHHPKETICKFTYECYSCNNIYLTKDDLPALIQQYEIELGIIQRAQTKGWDSEVQRHTKVTEIIKQHIINLGGEDIAQSESK